MNCFHGEAGAECVDDDFAATAGEINFDAEAEAFFGDEDGGEMRAFFEDAESFEIFVAVEFASFGETVFV